MNKALLAEAGKRVGWIIFLGLTFFSTAQLAQAARRGAEISIIRTDGGQLEGELITVRGDALVLLVDGLDASVDLGEISHITVVKKSHLLEGAGYGLLIGGGAGAVLGLAMGDDKPHFVYFTAGQKALLLGMALGAAGAIAGLIAGAEAGGAQIISMESRYTPEGKARILKKLNDLARIRSAS